MEQQADCFAGAWAQHVADSDDSNVHLSSSDLDTALAGLLTLSDPSGIDGGQDGAHGNGFDRVNAFQDGYEGGAQACADYQNNPPAVTETGYSSSEDQASGGNLPLSDMLPTVTKSLQQYWASQSSKLTAPTVVAATDGNAVTVTPTVACSTTRHLLRVEQHRALRRGHACSRCTTTIGDFASGMLLASAWSSSVEHQLGSDARHERRPHGCRVPGRGVGGRHRVVAVARRPRRSGHGAGRRQPWVDRPRDRLRTGGGVP